MLLPCMALAFSRTRVSPKRRIPDCVDADRADSEAQSAYARFILQGSLWVQTFGNCLKTAGRMTK
jgi:hypothetical protein